MSGREFATRTLAANDYTVGWICVHIHAHSAAGALLDEEHGRPEDLSVRDTSCYIFGKVGKHNVVVSVLLQPGPASAAVAATNMLRSFPNIIVGLVVGTGGGAPSGGNDIRLGDIVVGVRGDRDVVDRGVVQYDPVETIRNQSFRSTQFLNQSPTKLLAVVGGLKSRYQSEGHQLEAAIEAGINRYERLRKKYGRPDPGSDRLYRSEVIHPPNDERDCANACGEDPSKLEPRPERTEGENRIRIHYGPIASAYQPMNDASLRNKLAAEGGILCFETEAAGVINILPCLVICGICDYSDSHGNEEWKGYAAMAAAAYAKDLLNV